MKIKQLCSALLRRQPQAFEPWLAACYQVTTHAGRTSRATSTTARTRSASSARLALVVAVAVLSVGGCNRELYSPPSQLFAVPAARALQQGETTGGATVARQAVIFDPHIDVAELSLRHGLTGDFDIEGSAGYGVVGAEGAAADLDPQLITGRAGVIANPKRGPFTFRGGVGGGFNPSVGSYAAVDVGTTAAYQNCVVTPLVGASGFVSNPLSPRPINVADAGDTNVEVRTPTTTIGWTLMGSVGVQFDRAACQQGKAGTTLSLGINMTALTNGNGNDVWGGFGLRLEGSL